MISMVPAADYPCVKKCDNKPDGDYQSCLSCRFFASCSEGDLYDKRECPPGEVWDDNLKHCEVYSPTCWREYILLLLVNCIDHPSFF